MSTSTSAGAPRSESAADPAAKTKLVANEVAKLTATALNNGAVAAVITSVVGPAASGLYGITTPKSPYSWEFGGAWLLVGALLHAMARKQLKDLEP